MTRLADNQIYNAVTDLLIFSQYFHISIIFIFFRYRQCFGYGSVFRGFLDPERLKKT